MMVSEDMIHPTEEDDGIFIHQTNVIYLQLEKANMFLCKLFRLSWVYRYFFLSNPKLPSLCFQLKWWRRFTLDKSSEYKEVAYR